MRKFQIERDYYEEKEYIYKKKNIEINPGVTVLVGCNGAGKTTLIRQMYNKLKKRKIPCLKYDNLYNGGGHSISEAFFCGDVGFGATAMCSSEGENIVMNMGKFASGLKEFVITGKNREELRHEKIAASIRKINREKTDKEEIPNERWIFLDAVDSGLSVDNIVDLKKLFETVLEHNFGQEIYIIVSANEYEMARDEQCFDTIGGKYIEFKDYEDYRKYILKSRKEKEKRWQDSQKGS